MLTIVIVGAIGIAAVVIIAILAAWFMDRPERDLTAEDQRTLEVIQGMEIPAELPTEPPRASRAARSEREAARRADRARTLCLPHVAGTGPLLLSPAAPALAVLDAITGPLQAIHDERGPWRHDTAWFAAIDADLPKDGAP